MVGVQPLRHLAGADQVDPAHPRREQVHAAEGVAQLDAVHPGADDVDRELALTDGGRRHQRQALYRDPLDLHLDGGWSDGHPVGVRVPARADQSPPPTYHSWNCTSIVQP